MHFLLTRVKTDKRGCFFFEVFYFSYFRKFFFSLEVFSSENRRLLFEPWHLKDSLCKFSKSYFQFISVLVFFLHISLRTCKTLTGDQILVDATPATLVLDVKKVICEAKDCLPDNIK